ncbi:hypothetical protein ES703_102861 [subsurface metagenome]
MGSAIGIGIGRSTTTRRSDNNIIRNVTIEEVILGIGLSDGSRNIIDGAIITIRQNHTGVSLAATVGDESKLYRVHVIGTSAGPPLGIGVDIDGGRRAVVKDGDFDFLTTCIDIAANIVETHIENNGFHNSTTGVNIGADCARTVCRNNKYDSVTTPIVDAGIDSIFDLDIESVVLDLSGGATDVITFPTAVGPHWLCGYTVLYTEASSADAGVNIRIGRLQADGTFDDDYYDIVASEVSKAKGFSHRYKSADLLQAAIATGESVTVGIAGGKTGAGEVKVILHIARL